MLLRDIAKGLSGVTVKGNSQIVITDVTECARLSTKGSVFICRKGERFDGNDFIPEARRRGTVAFVSERNIPINDGECLIISKNARKTMAEISYAIYGSCLKGMKIIGVGGTKGKSTTASFIAKLLSDIGESAVVIGTLGIEFFMAVSEGISQNSDASIVNEKIYAAENTTPESDQIFKTLADAKERGCRYAVIEISSQALALGRVYMLPIDLAVFTNFSKDHVGIGEHGSIEEYRAAKLSLYEGRLAVINGDDALAEDILKTVKKCYTVGEAPSSDFIISDISSGGDKVGFSLNGSRVALSVGGDFNAKNAALAIASVSVLCGISPDRLAPCLADAKVLGRYEVYEFFKRRVIIDFAHNGESFKAIMNAERRESRGRIIAVFGSVGNRCKDRRRELACVAEKLADLSVITADNPGRESALEICKEIYSFYSDKSKAVIEPDRESAIKRALKLSREGDSVLLLGKGHESFQLIGDDRIYFSERDIILSLGAHRP